MLSLVLVLEALNLAFEPSMTRTILVYKQVVSDKIHCAYVTVIYS